MNEKDRQAIIALKIIKSYCESVKKCSDGCVFYDKDCNASCEINLPKNWNTQYLFSEKEKILAKALYYIGVRTLKKSKEFGTIYIEDDKHIGLGQLSSEAFPSMVNGEMIQLSWGLEKDNAPCT